MTDELELHAGSIIRINYSEFMIINHEWILNEKHALVPFGYLVVPHNPSFLSPINVSLVRLRDMENIEVVEKR